MSLIAERCTFISFLSSFENALPDYITCNEAYEAVEALHIELFGRRRFSEYQNFSQARRRYRIKVRLLLV
jgi:hypothetical protein